MLVTNCDEKEISCEYNCIRHRIIFGNIEYVDKREDEKYSPQKLATCRVID